MESVSALEFRSALKAYTEKVRLTGEPTILDVYGQSVVGIVPVEWAKTLEQVTLFDKCGLTAEVLKADLKQVLERALLEVSTNPQVSLSQLVKKLVDEASTVQQYHSMRKSLKLSSA